jgi:hypothetical protein
LDWPARIFSTGSKEICALAVRGHGIERGQTRWDYVRAEDIAGNIPTNAA